MKVEGTMDEHKGKWEFQQKSEFLKFFLKLWVYVTGIPFQASISCLLSAAHYLYQVQKQNDPSP